MKMAGSSWRFDSMLFRRGKNQEPHGVLNFSPLWFMNGWEVSITFGDQLRVPAHYVCQGKREGLTTSPFISSIRGITWMKEIQEAAWLLSGMLRVMHPAQYSMAYQVGTEIMKDEKFRGRLEFWPIIFNATSIIANRRCPLHRDSKGSFNIFDLLVTVGHYSKARLYLHPLGIQIPNMPGTVTGFSGRAFRHGVAAADGPRVCNAFYMRDSLRRYTRVRPAGCMTQEIYAPWVGSKGTQHLSNLSPNPFTI